MGPKARKSSGRPTLADVAEEAGVSAITVSRTIRSPERVSDGARLRVEEAIRRLGYIPDPAASALASRTTNVIGLLVPSLTNNVFTDVLRGVYDAAEGTRFFIQIGNFRYSALKEEALIGNFLSQRPAGLIVSGVNQSEAGREMLERATCPVVQIMDAGGDPIDMAVGFHHAAAAESAVRHLIECGYRRLGFIGARMDPRAQQRLVGFRAVCRQADLLDERRIVTTPQPSSVGMGCQLLEDVLSLAPDTDAMLCNNDDLAVGALMEARRRNIAVPEELGICSFNDVEMSRHMVPALTAIATPRAEIGRLAIEMILAEIAEPGSIRARQVDLGHRLEVRESTARRPGPNG